MISQLQSEGNGDNSLGENAARIEMLADAELKRVKGTDDGKKIAQTTRDWYNKCKAARMSEVRVWYKNLDMYQGRQFTEWDNNLKIMVEPTGPDYEPRIALNVLEPAMRTELAKTSSNKPTASIAPASNDQSDIMAAEAAEQVWESFYLDSRYQTEIFSDANFWRAICGNGFIKVFMDYTEIDWAATEAAQQQANQQAAQAQQDAMQQGIGDIAPPPPMDADGDVDVDPVYGVIRAESIPPFNIFVPDLTELRLQRQDYVIHAYTMNAEKAKVVYKNQTPANWQPTTVAAAATMLNSHLGVKGGNTAKLDSVEVLEMWVKPNVSKLFPKGGLVITVGDEIVAMSDPDDGMPYDHNLFPFAHLYSIETGRFYRKSVVQSLTPVQNEINRTYAQLIKAKNLMTKPQFFYQEGSLDPRRITSRAGLYIPVKPGFSTPTAVPMQGMPAYVMQLVQSMNTFLEDISGQHQVVSGPDSKAMSASGLSLMQESDDNFLSSIYDSIEAATEVVGRMYLSLVVQFWDLPRLVKVLGGERSFEAKMLTGVDIKNGCDLRIDSQSGLPISKAGRIATITDWIDKGIIDKEDGLEAMEMGTLGKVWERMGADKNAARKENITIRDLSVDDINAWNAQQAELAQQQAAQAAQQQSVQAEVDNLQAIYDYNPGSAAPGSTPDPTTGLPAPMPVRDSGPTAQTQPGAVAPAVPGQLVGSAAPAAITPQDPIFFPINFYDNDQVHMNEHRLYANSQEFANLDPAVQKVAEDHYYAHLKRYLDLQAYGNQRQSAMAVQEAAMMAQQAPTVMQTARIGGKNAFAGEQYTES
jgi:hypothetical protein